MSITVVFDPPLPSDNPATFNQKAFTLLGNLNAWSGQANQVAGGINADKTALLNAGLSTVSANISNVNAVGTNIASVNAAAANIAAIQNAATNASNAAASASAAATSASQAAASATNALNSANAASASATQALNSANAASTSAANAATSAAASAAYASMAQATNPDTPIRLNPRFITAAFTVPAAYNGASVGPISISDGVTVTIQDHATWSIH